MGSILSSYFLHHADQPCSLCSRPRSGTPFQTRRMRVDTEGFLWQQHTIWDPTSFLDSRKARALHSEYYELCVLNTEGEVSMTLNKECQTEGTYCSLQWKGQSCQSVGNYGNNTTTDLYGVCLPYDGSGETACPFE